MSKQSVILKAASFFCLLGVFVSDYIENGRFLKICFLISMVVFFRINAIMQKRGSSK